MKKYVPVLILLLLNCIIFAQDNERTPQKDIDDLKLQITRLNQTLDSLYLHNHTIRENYGQLIKSQKTLNQQFQQISQQVTGFQTKNYALIDSLGKNFTNHTAFNAQRIDTLDTRLTESQELTNQGISELGIAQSRNTFFWAVSILVVILMLILVYFLLKKNIIKRSEKMESNLIDTRKSLEEEGVKLDIKLMELLEKQLKLIKEERNGVPVHQDIDHSLVLKVADRLISIEKNLSRMDKGTKGLKQLERAVKNIKDNFAANGYEIVEMLGKSYNEGMKVTANFIPDENLEKGEQIITRIIKPQVNYKGVMIQSAQIEVSQGE